MSLEAGSSVYELFFLSDFLSLICHSLCKAQKGGKAMVMKRTTTTDGTFIGAMCTGARRRAATTGARLRHRHLRVAAGSGGTDCAPCAVAVVLEALESPGSLELLESHGAKAVYVFGLPCTSGFDIINCTT